MRDHTNCQCKECRDAVEDLILMTFDEKLRWLGIFQARAADTMTDAVPMPLYALVFAEMVIAGKLIQIKGRSFNDFSVYLPFDLTGCRFEPCTSTWLLVPELGRNFEQCQPGRN
jgi:hypothetical protein